MEPTNNFRENSFSTRSHKILKITTITTTTTTTLLTLVVAALVTYSRIACTATWSSCRCLSLAPSKKSKAKNWFQFFFVFFSRTPYTAWWKKVLSCKKFKKIFRSFNFCAVFLGRQNSRYFLWRHLNVAAFPLRFCRLPRGAHVACHSRATASIQVVSLSLTHILYRAHSLCPRLPLVMQLKSSMKSCFNNWPQLGRTDSGLAPSMCRAKRKPNSS